MIGYAFCGSFCTHAASLEILRQLRSSGEDILPIMSGIVSSTDTRFGRAEDLMWQVRDICGRDVVTTVKDAEPLGPATPLEALIICPCTGNTLAKMSLGITDTSVTMAVKAHLRCDRPLLIALASNDAMSANLTSVAQMLRRKSVYFVPMRQDDPQRKPHSLVFDKGSVIPAFHAMREGQQLRPLFI